MLYSINSKFYAIAILLTISHCLNYGILAYFQHEQNQNSQLTQDAIVLKQDISTLTKLFYEARFWEKVILTGDVPEANMHFGATLEEIRSQFNVLNKKHLNSRSLQRFNEIIKQLSQYEASVANLIQIRTSQSLHTTRMESNYRPMASIILTINDPELLKPLFSFTHFFISYHSTKNLHQYQALKLMGKALERQTGSMQINDLQLRNAISTFNTLLDENYEMELEIKGINHNIERISVTLHNILSDMAVQSTRDLELSLNQTNNSREELKILFLFTSLLGILVIMLILSIISRNIILPIRSIAEVMQKVKSGETRARFQSEQDSQDEIVRFGQSFNEMLEKLESNTAKLIEYQKDIEAKFHEVSRREIERQQLTTQLRRSEQIEAIGTLAGGVAHDLNNILSGVVSYPEMLLLELPEDSPYRNTIRTIEESGRKASEIVQDLLTLARRGVSVTQTTHLNMLISDYLASPEHLNLTSRHPEVKLHLNLHKDLRNINGSPVHLSKTIMNLIENGVESINGKGTVTIRTENRYLSSPLVGYQEVEKGDYAVMTVRDTGAGIAQENIHRIFEPFFSRKNLGTSGTGLGLAVVWNTVRDHNGYIDVKSRIGEGTTFTVYFPVTDEQITPAKTVVPIESYMGNGEQILVVDDIESQREIACSMLQKLGYTALSTSSGEKAIEYMLSNHADLLVLDMLMPPGIDGLETYKQILKTSPEMPAIIASGFSETDRVKQARLLGAMTYIKKPYSLEILGTAVKAALKRYASQ